MILPFDAHNHVHMGPTSPVEALLSTSTANAISNEYSSTPEVALRGMAVMSTHPRDWGRVLTLSKELMSSYPGCKVVPCFGVHPWFLHEVSANDWGRESSDSLPRWVQAMEKRLMATPNSIVGEIGLDGYHFDPTTKELVSPMDKQVEAFRYQLELAARLERPVSIHAVQCFGPLMDTLCRLRKSKHGLPPKTYFHAFGGKSGTVDQLLALCGREIGDVYFGFAPVVNFRSPKTADLVRKVGIERLLLETDHEDAARVSGSMREGIQFMAEALECSADRVVERTTQNAFAFYNLSG